MGWSGPTRFPVLDDDDDVIDDEDDDDSDDETVGSKSEAPTLLAR